MMPVLWASCLYDIIWKLWEWPPSSLYGTPVRSGLSRSYPCALHHIHLDFRKKELKKNPGEVTNTRSPLNVTADGRGFRLFRTCLHMALFFLKNNIGPSFSLFFLDFYLFILQVRDGLIAAIQDPASLSTYL